MNAKFIDTQDNLYETRFSAAQLITLNFTINNESDKTGIFNSKDHQQYWPNGFWMDIISP